MEEVSVNSPILESSKFTSLPDISILIGFKPGVTDNRAQAALDGLQTLFPTHEKIAVSTMNQTLNYDMAMVCSLNIITSGKT